MLTFGQHISGLSVDGAEPVGVSVHVWVPIKVTGGA